MLRQRRAEANWNDNRNKNYIALENLDYSWTKERICQVQDLWNAGFSLEYISRETNRDIDELAILIMDLDYHLFMARSHGIEPSRTVKVPQRIRLNRERFETSFEGEYLVFESCPEYLYWHENDVFVFEHLWREGYSIDVISDRLQRTKIEVALLIIDRCREEAITSRKNGLDGNQRAAIAI